MISAQIKKGNIFLIDSLQDYMLQMITLPHNPSFKPLKLNYYNFIQTLAQLVNQYSKSKTTISFNLYIIDNFVRKYEKNGDLYRYFFGLTQSWKRYADNHEDAKLFLSVLSNQRNNKQTVKRFVKIRKIILKTINAKILQEISVTHSDALTICHMLFEGENRNKVTKKINTLFISLKRKLVNTAKYGCFLNRVNGAVACQFFMSATQELQQQNYPQKQIVLINRGHDKRISQNKKKEIEKNYQLSFSQEYASSYQKDKYNETINIPELQQQWAILQEHKNDNKPNQWRRQKGVINLNQAKHSLNELSRKDRDIDARLQGSGLIEWKNYPQGWDQFIKNNQKQKQKLLNGNKAD